MCWQQKHGDRWRRGADGDGPCVFGVQHARCFAWFCWFDTRYITAFCEIVPFSLSRSIEEELKREEERREAEESTRMAAEEQRQKDVCQAQKEEEERHRMAEEQRREEASELLVFSASLTWVDCQERLRQEQQREAEEIARMAAEEQLLRERVQAEEARRRMEEGCRHLMVAALF